MKEKGGLPNLKMPTSDDRLLWDAWMSLNLFPALTVADELGMFSYLEKKSATAKEVAESLSLHEEGTEALLGILTSLGFLVQNQGQFHLTASARTYLLPESPFYWGGMLHAARNVQNMHSAVKVILQTNESYLYKNETVEISERFTSSWENQEYDLEQAGLFTRAMHSRSFPAAIDVARWGDFTNASRLLDIGGGSGCFCIALAQSYPKIHFTVMELPVVCKVTQEYIAHYGLQDRIDTLARDMLKDEWPSGYDAILFSNVFHDWNRDRCDFLCKRSFDILPSGGHIHVHEILLNDTRDGPLTTALYSLTMMLVHEGRLFTAGELTGLLERHGFEDISIISTHPYCSLVSGRKP
ncbi:MAG: class I SAM-dependent methyltransferase [Theionarchaea archaeon]|nr:class I SAM-dependent methyltransferase [Theionarchaea archaeon]MBU7038465.1 class I SAM-dependent methyltransferase [Theionarchaea archaeon]